MKRIVTFICAIVAVGSGVAKAQTFLAPHYFVEQVVSGLSLPVNMVFIGPDELLVSEKQSGRVRHILNGAIAGTALNLPAATTGERGILGLCLHPDFETNGLVYIFWCRSDVLGGAWLDNRIDRFQWNGSTLTFESTIATFGPVAGQPSEQYHHGGVMRIGPDNKLYVITGDMGRGYAGSSTNIEQNRGLTTVAGVGAIHRYNLDGTIPPDNPFTYHSDPSIKSIYAYGIRNSWGIEFDPITGNLWMTDNGPEVYDEVNRIEAGMNGGWLLIVGPDERDVIHSGLNNVPGGPFNQGHLAYLKNAFYRDPVFSWSISFGVTSIAFMTGRKVRPEERNKVIIAQITTPGRIYMFDLNQSRDDFVLAGPLADRVADGAGETALNEIGTNWSFTGGWGGVTDFRYGPDGFLYALSYAGGRVFRIRPVVEEIIPGSMNLFRGMFVSGNLQSLFDSDDDRLVIRPGFTLSVQEPPIQLILSSHATLDNPSEIRFRLEAHVSTPSIRQRIELYNYVANSWEEVDSRVATTSDSVVDVTITTNPTRFIDPITREMQAKISYRQEGPVFAFPWQARIDQAVWHQVMAQTR